MSTPFTFDKSLKDLERRMRYLSSTQRSFDTLAQFPSVGKVGVIYIDESTGDIYTWDSAQYVSSKAPSVSGVYADNAAALLGGLVAGDVYRTSDGTLKIVY